MSSPNPYNAQQPPMQPQQQQPQAPAKDAPSYRGMKILLSVFGAVIILTALIGLGMVFFGADYETADGMLFFVSSLVMTSLWGIWSVLIDISKELQKRH